MLSLIAAASSTPADSTASQVSTILNAIAPLLWVAVVVAAIAIFRKPLSAAIGRVSEVDVGTAKVVLQNQADIAANTAKQVAGRAKQVASATGKQVVEADSKTKEAISQATSSATTDPSGSVLTAWRAVENAAGAATAGQVRGVMSPPVPQVVNDLAKGNQVESALVPVAETLESLRKMATIKPKAITPATATSFVAAAADLADVITQAGPAENTAS